MKKLFVVLFAMILTVSAFGQEQQSENFAFVSSVKGRVLLQEEQAKQDQYILKYDWLNTDKDGTTEIRFGEEGGYLSVGENSKVFFVEVNSKKTVIAFFQGTLYMRNLENVELRAAGKPEGKIILSEKDKTIRVDIVGDNVNIENVEPAVVEPEAESEPESETEAEPEKEQQNISHYYSYFWRYWGPCFFWYPGWYSWYPIYYNYGYYYGYYNYPYQYQNQNQYNYGSSYSGGSSVQRVVTKNQLQRRQITVRPSRVNTNFVRPTRNVVNRKIVSFPSRVSKPTIRSTTSTARSNVLGRLMRQSSSSSVSRTQSRTTSSYRVPVPTNSRNTTVSRSSSSVNRSVSKPVNRSVSRSTSRPTSRPISRSASGKSTSGSIRKK